MFFDIKPVPAGDLRIGDVVIMSDPAVVYADTITDIVRVTADYIKVNIDSTLYIDGYWGNTTPDEFTYGTGSVLLVYRPEVKVYGHHGTRYQ